MMNMRRGTGRLVVLVLGLVGSISVIALTSFPPSKAARPAPINKAAKIKSNFSPLQSSAIQQSGQDQAEPLNHTAEARGRIAFASERDGNYEIYVMDPGGGGAMRLTTNTAVDREPAWSPDGTRIVFVSDRDGVGSTEIYVMNADGGNPTRLTNNMFDDVSPVWSPDGSRIAFVSDRTGDNEIFTMNPDGSGATNLSRTPGFDDIDPAWSPNSQRIAFATTRDDNTTYEIYTMAADGSGQTRLTNNSADDAQPAWPPGRIIFTSERDGNAEIYSMSATDGSGQTRLTNNPASDVDPAASSDGTQIVFASDRDFPSGTGGFEIYTMTAAGNVQTRLTSNGDDNDFEPAVQRITNTSVQSRLFVANLDSEQEVPQNFSPGTGIGTLLLSPDETTATVSLTFSGLTAPETAAHIHLPAPPGVNAPVVFPLPNGTFTNVQINVTPAQVQTIKAGLSYFNVHTTNFPGGEIRGQINAVAPVTPPPAPSVAFAITSGNRLIEFNTSRPGVITRTNNITGLQSGEMIRGIDIRPANGQLYALGSTSRLYTINVATGAATAVGSGPFTPALSGNEFGFDFNPTVDRIRVVSDTGQNLRLHPDTGAVAATDTALRYATGDANASRTPSAVGSAYTNNFAGATSTTLYNIDSGADILVTQNPPNEGVLNTIGPLGFDTSAVVGFDIAAGSGVGFAALTAANATTSGLYTIDLATGAATLVANIGGTETIRGLAVASSAVFQLSQASYTVSEGTGRLTITVTRTGDISGESEVDFETSDSTARERSDYTTASGVLRFESGERTKSFDIFIIDDVYAEGDETFSIALAHATGAALGTTNTVTVTITDNDPGSQTPASANPIDNTPFFVRQQYIDFLNREPEPDGFNAWVGVLNRCPNVNNDPSCDRIEVSSSFFRSAEFQEKGFFVIRFYRAAFGRVPSYREFVRDLGRINGRTDVEVIANRFAFIDEFLARPAFIERYNVLSNAQFVDTVLQTAGLTITNRDQLVRDLDTGEATRAEVFTEIVENPQFADQEFNRAFVLSQYFGYLRRDPEEAGFNAWLAVLNRNRNDFRTMVNGFMNSREYRLRFGPQ